MGEVNYCHVIYDKKRKEEICLYRDVRVLLDEQNQEIDRLQEENRRLRRESLKSAEDMPDSFHDYVLLKLDEVKGMERELRRLRELEHRPERISQLSYGYAVDLMRKVGYYDPGLAEQQPFYRSMVDNLAFFIMNILSKERETWETTESEAGK